MQRLTSGEWYFVANEIEILCIDALTEMNSYQFSKNRLRPEKERDEGGEAHFNINFRLVSFHLLLQHRRRKILLRGWTRRHTKNIVTDARQQRRRRQRVVNVVVHNVTECARSHLISNDINNCSRHLSRPLELTHKHTEHWCIYSPTNICKPRAHILK